ncbi:MAG: glycosyltransferase [Gemmatimonadetes bacterium]|nr:MAG: glycosyltransferase [Gemmatimonadota bacterium]
MPPLSCRIAFYSHDTMGLGHMRRNLLLAQALKHSRLQAVVLMIAGAREASLVTGAAGVDCVALPSLQKDGQGQYHPRHLDVPLPELLALRAKTACAALEAFDPDVLIVDNVPRGAVRELDPVLESLRARHRTRLVLGLRDVLDDPITVQREWARAQNQDAVRRYYDAVWVYGDPTVYDPVREYAFAPDVAAKVRYTGYLDQRARLKFVRHDGRGPAAALGLSPGWLALCLVGGGQDGAALAEAFVEAELPPDTNGLLVTGPCMPVGVRRRLMRSVASNPRRRVVSFVHEPTRLVRRADRVVAMGGYNTVYEILSFEKPALIVPRVTPRQEQLIRAERLRALGLVDVLHPEGLSAAALSAWLARGRAPVRPARERIDFNGLSRVPQLLEELLGSRPPLGPRRRVRAEVYDAA